jgi:ER lumen protein retaining receptor
MHQMPFCRPILSKIVPIPILLFPWTGLSLKTQEITALFLAARLACSVLMELDAHSVLDMATLISTAWVIYMIRFKLKSTYIKELDNMPLYYLVKTLFFYNIVLNVIEQS